MRCRQTNKPQTLEDPIPCGGNYMSTDCIYISDVVNLSGLDLCDPDLSELLQVLVAEIVDLREQVKQLKNKDNE